MKVTFEQWKSEVTRIMERQHGLHPDDLPDMPYHRWWDDGKTATMAVKSAIRRAKTEC